MSTNGSTIPTGQTGTTEPASKGKGKQAALDSHDDMQMDDNEEEESSGEEEEVEEPVQEDDEDMAEIDPSNIIGSQTRGKQINWAEAEAKSREAGDELDDEEDEDEDEDYVDPEQGGDDDMRD